MPQVTAAGLTKAYRVLELRRSLAEALPDSSPLRFEPVSQANLHQFRVVQNDAFRTSPNGATVSESELRARLSELTAPDLWQVGYLEDQPAAIVQVCLSGDTGEIEAIAVAPAFQGCGVGRKVLHRAMRTIRNHGAATATLQVVESNDRALALYRAEGFDADRLLSTWFNGPTLCG